MVDKPVPSNEEAKKTALRLADDVGAGAVSVIPLASGVQQSVQDDAIVKTHNGLQDTKEKLIALAEEAGVDASALKVEKDRSRNALSAVRSFVVAHVPFIGGSTQEIAQNHQITAQNNQIVAMQEVARQVQEKTGSTVDLKALDATKQSDGLLEDVATYFGREMAYASYFVPNTVTAVVAGVQQGEQHHRLQGNVEHAAALKAAVDELRVSAATQGISGTEVSRVEGSPTEARAEGHGTHSTQRG